MDRIYRMRLAGAIVRGTAPAAALEAAPKALEW
jgi:hypothetical protein